jgi:hypothetical protein
MAAEAPEAIAAAEKTKQVRAGANAKRASAKEQTAQAAHKTRQEELKTVRHTTPKAATERAGGAPVNQPDNSPSLSDLPTIPKSSGNTGHRVIAASWVAGMIVITWQEISVNKRPPDPRRFVGWSATMGILDLLSILISAELAGVFAVGFVLGILFFRKPVASTKPGTGDTTGNTAATSADNGTGTGTSAPLSSNPQTLGSPSNPGNVPFSTSAGIGDMYTGGGIKE